MVRCLTERLSDVQDLLLKVSTSMDPRLHDEAIRKAARCLSSVHIAAMFDGLEDARRTRSKLPCALPEGRICYCRSTRLMSAEIEG